MGKPKICKCGHNSNTHKGKSKLAFRTYCRTCPCSSYMNRNRPFKSDYGFLVLTVGLAVFFIIASLYQVTNADPKLDGTQNDTVTFTVGEIYELMFLVIILIDFWLVFSLVVEPILEIMYAKKRREFPIDENDKL